MASPKSTSLFHFTKSLDILQSILKTAFYPRFILEDVSWLDIPNVTFFSFPIVSLCDIPIGRIDEHVEFYGQYGLGMSNDWARGKGLNPVFYISPSAPISSSFLKAIQAAIRADIERPNKGEMTKEHMKFMLANVKPLSGTMLIQNNPISKDFYLENEWRYVPNIKGIPFAIKKEEYDDTPKINKLNSHLMKQAPLSFNSNDIRYIFVKEDADIPPLVDFINSKLNRFSFKDLKILTTRIISLEYLRKDI